VLYDENLSVKNCRECTSLPSHDCSGEGGSSGSFQSEAVALAMVLKQWGLWLIMVMQHYCFTAGIFATRLSRLCQNLASKGIVSWDFDGILWFYPIFHMLGKSRFTFFSWFFVFIYKFYHLWFFQRKLATLIRVKKIIPYSDQLPEKIEHLGSTQHHRKW
jgi:hypothetical protein